MELMFQPFRKYADFQGRARRSEYWLWTLFIIIVEVVAYALMGVMGGFSTEGSGANPLAMIVGLALFIFALAIFIPSLAVSFRRLHDTDRSAWWILISFIPFGGIVLLVFNCLDGTPGPNKYGPDPKGRGASDPVNTFS